MATRRSDKFTEGSIQPIIFADITQNADIHPQTGDLFRITNANAIKRAIKNLVLTNKYERFYQPNIGGNILNSLFEPMSLEANHMILTAIQDTLRNYESRISNLQVLVNDEPDQNRVNITVIYTIDITPEPQSLNIYIDRIR